MRGFVILRSDGPNEPALMRQTRNDLEGSFDRVRHVADGLWVYFSDDLDLIEGPTVAVVGQAFGDVRRAFKENEPNASATLLLRHAWGRYVAIWNDGSLLRSPLGFLDVFTWRTEGFQVVCSVAPRALDRTFPATVGIDAAKLAKLFQRLPDCLGDSPLCGIDTVHPGELYRDGVRKTLWLWREHADKARNAEARDVRRAVIDCVEAWISRFPSFVAELSGGLDSAIVMSALRRLDVKPRLTLNYYEPTRGADERHYAVEQAKHLGFLIDCRPKSLLDLCVDVRDHSVDVRPSFARLDSAYDDDAAGALAEVGGQAIIGGQGGDAVFFQMPHPWIAADALHPPSPRSFARLCGNLAGWTGGSAWSIAAQALRGEYIGGSPYKSPAGAAGVRDTLRLATAPAKRLQIRALQSSQVFFGPCARSDAGALIHPLLSQPLVELCLSIPSSQLTDQARRDRAMARDAFRRDLTPAIYARRSKGALSSFYARSVAASARNIREHLGGGRLAQLGVVNTAWLDQMLQHQNMILRGDLSQLLTLLLMERYVRKWEARLAESRASAKR